MNHFTRVYFPSGFESFILGEKTAVIFDIGSVYTKCGFAGESGPRFILPTKTGQNRWLGVMKTPKEKKAFFIEFFYDLYYRNLLVNPKDRRVVIIESILGTSEFRDLIADVLYHHFEVPSTLFAPAHLVALFTLGLSSALVLDCGYKEAVVLPVLEGYTLVNSWQAGPLGSRAVYKNLELLLLKNSVIIDEDHNFIPLSEFPDIGQLVTEDMLEDLMVRTSFVSPSARARQWKEWIYSNDSESPVEAPKVAEAHFIYPIGGLNGSKRLQIPSQLRELGVECLFQGDNDNITLATLILRSVQTCPIDVRRLLAENIILIGGTVTIPGFSARLLEEIDLCLASAEFSNLAALKGKFRIHNPPAEPNCVAWLGGAIFGALESLPGRSLERAAYLEKGFLPDWTTAIDADPHPSDSRPEATRQ